MSMCVTLWVLFRYMILCRSCLSANPPHKTSKKTPKGLYMRSYSRVIGSTYINIRSILRGKTMINQERKNQIEKSISQYGEGQTLFCCDSCLCDVCENTLNKVRIGEVINGRARFNN